MTFQKHLLSTLDNDKPVPASRSLVPVAQQPPAAVYRDAAEMFLCTTAIPVHKGDLLAQGVEAYFLVPARKEGKDTPLAGVISVNKIA